jgi:hypothetical protein
MILPKYADVIIPVTIPVSNNRNVANNPERCIHVRNAIIIIIKEELSSRWTEDADRVISIPVPVSCDRNIARDSETDV